MKPVTIHFRAGKTGKGRYNELCLSPRYWRTRIDGITLRDDITIVNCMRCRVLYSRLWRDLPGEMTVPSGELALPVPAAVPVPEPEPCEDCGRMLAAGEDCE